MDYIDRVNHAVPRSTPEEPTTVSSTRGHRDRSWWIVRLRKSIWFRCLVLAVAWQAALTFLGRIVASPELPGAYVSFFDGLLGHTNRWDGEWYLLIIEQGYGADPSAPAFYPLFPLLVAVLRWLTGGLVGLLVLGLVVNVFATTAFLVGLRELLARFGVASRSRRYVVGFFLTASPAIFLHMFYTEALFMAIAVWAYVFCLRRQWHWMGLLLAASTATRLPGLLLIGLCALEFARAHGWAPRRFLNWNALWVFAGFGGFGAYALYLALTLGDPLAMVNNLRESPLWTYHVFNPNVIETLTQLTTETVRTISGTGATPTAWTFFSKVFPLLSLAAILGSSIYLAFALRGKSVPLVVYGVVSIVFFSLNSNLISVHRYAFSSLAIFVAIGVLVQRHPSARLPLLGVMYVGAVLQGWWLYMWIYSGTIVS